LSINTNKNGKRYWKCKKAADCRVTAITEGDHLVNHRGEHTHASDEALPNIKVLTHRAKEMAKNQPTRPMKRIFSEVFGSVDLDDERNMDHLPNLRNIKNSLYLSRASRLPRIPHSRVEVQLEGEWRHTLDGRDFILANDGEDDRLIIFGTVHNLRLLCQSDTIYMDGTFKMAPEMFSQVYSIHICYLGTMLPMAIALLPAKTQQTYSRFLRLVSEAAMRYGMQFQPHTVCIDFESAMIAAVQEVLNNARIRGCLFHFSQALWRKIQDLGLTIRYKEDQAFNRLVRRAAALPLVPPNLVHDVWMMALNEVADEEVDRFKDYVTTTWVDDIAARFPVELWSQYDNIAGMRTNNHLEGWHSKLNHAINRPHPNIFALIELLKEEQRR
jgi:hypothetical protein